MLSDDPPFYLCAMYPYLRALHIIFVVTWFSGLFYVVRLFIYNTEAADKPDREKNILRSQFSIMIRRLWTGITWPSAILTLILGPWVLYLYGTIETWMWIKLGFVLLLLGYQLSLQKIYREQMRGLFRYTSSQLRIWNEVATIFLVAIVMLVSVKSAMSFVWGLIGLAFFVMVLMTAVRIYRHLREK